MLRILDYPWHQVHLYRMATALPATFGVAAIREPYWNEAQRPIPDNVISVPQTQLGQSVDEGDWDVALLHLDQWCDRQTLRAWPYRFMKQSTQAIPQIVIMHGTPDFPENRAGVLRLIGDLPVVCNSRHAAMEWDGGEGRVDRYGLPQFRAVIHGYRVDEFRNYPFDQRRIEAFTICSGGTMSSEYHGLPLAERLMRDVPLAWYGPRGNREWKNSYGAYLDMLASSLIYVSPTRRAPMPGARTEAMLSGCCVVSVPGNDWEGYITNGLNGYVVDTYAEMRRLIRELLEHPVIAYNMGQAGRARALATFGHERFAADWLRVLAEIGVAA